MGGVFGHVALFEATTFGVFFQRLPDTHFEGIRLRFGSLFRSIFGMFAGSSEMLIFMTPLMRKLCFRGSGRMLFCTFLWSRQLCPIFDDVGCLAGSLWAPLGHITAFFPLLIFSRFLRCVFLTFRLPRGSLNGSWRHAPGPSGALVKHHFGSGSDGSTEVERHSVNLHPGASA